MNRKSTCSFWISLPKTPLPPKPPSAGILRTTIPSLQRQVHRGDGPGEDKVAAGVGDSQRGRAGEFQHVNPARGIAQCPGVGAHRAGQLAAVSRHGQRLYELDGHPQPRPGSEHGSGSRPGCRRQQIADEHGEVFLLQSPVAARAATAPQALSPD